MKKNPTPTEKQKPGRQRSFARAVAQGSASRTPGGRIGTSRGDRAIRPGALGGRVAVHPPSFPVSLAGHSLQRVPEDPPVQPGHVPLRRLLPKRWLGRRGPLATAQRRDGDQAPQ